MLSFGWSQPQKYLEIFKRNKWAPVRLKYVVTSPSQKINKHMLFHKIIYDFLVDDI